MKSQVRSPSTPPPPPLSADFDEDLDLLLTPTARAPPGDWSSSDDDQEWNLDAASILAARRSSAFSGVSGRSGGSPSPSTRVVGPTQLSHPILPDEAPLDNYASTLLAQTGDTKTSTRIPTASDDLRDLLKAGTGPRRRHTSPPPVPPPGSRRAVISGPGPGSGSGSVPASSTPPSPSSPYHDLTTDADREEAARNDPWSRALITEILRKLRLVPLAEALDDKDTVLQEIFTDITGEIAPPAQAKLGAAAGTCFYEVLAQFLERHDAIAEEVLAMCRSMWAHAFVAPIFALLLHRWILVHPTAGGEDERTKNLLVLTRGARDLFLGDSHGGCEKFRPMFHFLFYRVAMDVAVLDTLSQESRHQLLSTVAALVPYYMPSSTLRTCLSTFPSPNRVSSGCIGTTTGTTTAIIPTTTTTTTTTTTATNLADVSTGISPSTTTNANTTNTTGVILSATSESERPLAATPSSSLSSLSSLPSSTSTSGSGPDFLVESVVRVLKEMRSEVALRRTLRALQGLADCPALEGLATMTRVRLQIELYSLTTPGAPRWAPQSVRQAALRALDVLFPMGASARRLVCFAFQLLHPGEVAQSASRWAFGWLRWPWQVAHATSSWGVSLAAWWASMWVKAALAVPGVSKALPMAVAIQATLERAREGNGGNHPPPDAGEVRGGRGGRWSSVGNGPPPPHAPLLPFRTVLGSSRPGESHPREP